MHGENVRIFNPKEPNQLVQHVHNPGIRGVTTGKTREDGTDVYVQIQIGANEKKWYPVDDLELFVGTGDDIEDLLRNLRFGKKHDLSRVLNFHKISSDLSNVFYSMQASRTEFYAHQFKPVYKYIESLDGRILIADEVGLGKTIEAGLIWLETKARQPDARRLLVVCPPMLTEKWKMELRARFDTNADICDARALVERFADFRREAAGYSCALVCSLNSVRQDRVFEALENLEDANLKFDLVIVDESHHMRNVSTKSHKVGKLLSDLTDSMVLLSATPIQLKDEDLFRQLNILNPAEFDNYELVKDRLGENEPIIRAQSLLRAHPPRIASAVEEVTKLREFTWFRDSELLDLVEKQLQDLSSTNRTALIEVGRRLEKLNLFSSTICRTRKREVQEKRVEREAQAIAVMFTETEMDFYNRVTKSVQDRVSSSSEGPVAGFALMMPQRMMASSIPAMVEHYRSNESKDDEVFDTFGILSDTSGSGDRQEKVWLDLEQAILTWKSEFPDSKFEALAETLTRLFADESSTKVIIFSYFKKTLAYLQRRLSKLGLSPLVIHGGVPIEDRQEIISSFREELNRRILLSSEVGSEGIDLQFCRVIINYDLPWNPMKVEQRIGRVDRLGQEAEKINILNLSVCNTIEEKILNRLYSRIGIFERSLGDLEPILGEVAEKLHLELLSHHLTPEQEDKRIEETKRAIETNLQLERELSDQSAVFLGSSEYILEQIGHARESGRWITPNDLSSFIQDFFEHNFRGTVVVWDKPEKGYVSIRLTNPARNEFETYCRSQNPQLSTNLFHSSSESRILIYDPQKAQYGQKFELLNHFHPLLKWIANTHRNKKDAFLKTSAVDLKSSTVPSDKYLVVIQFWTFHGIQKRVQIEYAFTSLTDGIAPEADVAEKLVQEILQYGENWEFAGQMLDGEQVLPAWDKCINDLNSRYKSTLEEFTREDNELASRRRNHLQAFSLRKQEQAVRAIETLTEKLAYTSGRDRARIEGQIRGNETKIANLKNRLHQSLSEIERSNRVQHAYEEVAAVVCRVINT